MRESIVLKEDFKFPEDISEFKKPYKHERLVVPSKMLHIGMITKDIVEVREGPGSHYNLKPFLLKKNDQIIIFERIKKWVRFSLPQADKKGWIHFQTLEDFKEEKMVTLFSEDLPPLFSTKDLQHVYTYSDQKKMKIFCPKRTIFFQLKTNKEKVLVWIPNTSQVVWLDKKQAF